MIHNKNLGPKPIKLPSDQPEKCQVVQNLLGWQLVCGKRRIDCQSQEEAELLRFFTLMRRDEVVIPDNRNLKKDLEIVKLEYQRINNILDEALEGIVNYKIAERIRCMVWENILTSTTSMAQWSPTAKAVVP